MKSTKTVFFLGLTGHDMVKKNDTVIIFDTVTIWLWFKISEKDHFC